MSEPPIPVGAKVELLPGRDEVYPHAVAGSRGFVRKQKEDSHGYPLVWVEWDKEHWRYNGEADGWTFESHFKVIGDPSPVDEILASAQERRDEERCAHCGEEHNDDVKRAQTHVETISEALEEAVDSDAFFLIAVRSAPPYGEFKVYIPSIFDSSLSDEARIVLEAHLAEVMRSKEDE